MPVLRQRSSLGKFRFKRAQVRIAKHARREPRSRSNRGGRAVIDVLVEKVVERGMRIGAAHHGLSVSMALPQAPSGLQLHAGIRLLRMLVSAEVGRADIQLSTREILATVVVDSDAAVDGGRSQGQCVPG